MLTRTKWMLTLAGMTSFGCGAGQADGAYTRNALRTPGSILIGAPGPSGEVRATDGATFRFVSDYAGTTCFAGMIDNRLGDGAALTYSLRLYTDPTGDPIETATSGAIRVVNERTIVDQGFIPTDRFVIGPDGRNQGRIVQVGTVEQPVLDVEICFEGTSIGGAQFIVLHRNPRENDRAAPSYAAWRRQ